MRAGLGPDRRAPRLRRAHRRRPLYRRDVEDHHRLIEEFGKAAHPLHRLHLGQTGMRQGVMRRPRHPACDQLILHPAQQTVILRMDADQRALPAHLPHNLHDLAVVQPDGISREQLDRPVPRRDGRAQVIGKARHRQVRDRQVERMIHPRPARRPRGIGRQRVGQPFAPRLRREGDHRGRAAQCCGGSGRLEPVGVQQAHAGHLFHMGMRIDAPRHHPAARRLQNPRAGQPRRQRRDAPTRHTHVAGQHALRRDHPPAADHQIKVHAVPPEPGRIMAPPPGGCKARRVRPGPRFFLQKSCPRCGRARPARRANQDYFK